MSKFLCLNGVNSNKNGISIRQPIMKWILILLLCVQLASIVSNLIVSSLLDGSGLLDLSYYPHSPTLNTDGTSDSVILESNLFLSLMNGTEYHGVDIYTLYTTTRQRLTKKTRRFRPNCTPHRPFCAVISTLQRTPRNTLLLKNFLAFQPIPVKRYQLQIA